MTTITTVLAADGVTHLATARGRITGPLRSLLWAWVEMAGVAHGEHEREVSCKCGAPFPHTRWTLDPERLPLSGVRTRIEEIREGQVMGGFPHDVRDLTMDNLIILEWHGSFTPGRWARLTTWADGGRDVACLEWDSGTAGPSWWIGRALAEAGLAPLPPCEPPRLEEPTEDGATYFDLDDGEVEYIDC